MNISTSTDGVTANQPARRGKQDNQARAARPTVVALINRRSGAAMDVDHAAIDELLRTAFAAEDLDIVSHTASPEDLPDQLAVIAETRPDCLIVCGGDGTLRTAATVATGLDITLGVLPMGTMNRFAADIGMPADPAQAAAVLARAVSARSVQKVDTAAVNDRLFLCNSFVGLPPRYSRGRSVLRGRPFWQRMAGYLRLLRAIVRRRHRLLLDIDDGEQVERVRVLSLAVSNNLYHKAGARLFRRPALDGGTLGLYVSRHRSVFGLARKLLVTALGRWRSDARFTYRPVRSVTIGGSEDRFAVSNDGEVEVIDAPLVYTIRPGALDMLVPAASPGNGNRA